MSLFSIKVPPRTRIRDLNMREVLGVRLSGVENPIAAELRVLHEANADWAARHAPEVWLQRPEVPR